MELLTAFIALGIVAAVVVIPTLVVVVYLYKLHAQRTHLALQQSLDVERAKVATLEKVNQQALSDVDVFKKQAADQSTHISNMNKSFKELSDRLASLELNRNFKGIQNGRT